MRRNFRAQLGNNWVLARNVHEVREHETKAVDNAVGENNKHNVQQAELLRSSAYNRLISLRCPFRLAKQAWGEKASRLLLQ